MVKLINEEIVRCIRVAHFHEQQLKRKPKIAFNTRYSLKFQISPKAVHDVVHFRTWKYVKLPIVEEEEGLDRALTELAALDPFDLDWPKN